MKMWGLFHEKRSWILTIPEKFFTSNLYKTEIAKFILQEGTVADLKRLCEFFDSFRTAHTQKKKQQQQQQQQQQRQVI
jgi:hypothetical protein